MELKDYLDFFKKRWIVILVVLVLFVAAALVYSFVQEPVYQARATCMVSASMTAQGEYSAIQIIQQLLETINNIAVSRPVLDSTSSKLRGTRGYDELKKSISSKVLTDTQIIVISAKDAQPLTAMLEANAAADSLIEFINRNQGNSAYRIEKVEPATVPTSPVSPKPLRNALLGGFIGLISGIAVAAVLESIDVSVKTSDEIGQVLDRPVLAEIPLSVNNPVSVLSENGPGDSGILEATRTLRTNIQYMDIQGNLKLLLVTSPSAREGKTFISKQLARAFAATGKKSILVDADLRKTEHDPEANARGLTDVIIGNAAIEDAIIHREPEQIDVLSSGPLPPNPSEMLDSAVMHKLLDELRASYDVVLLDTSPIGMFSDPFVLASRADGVILVVEARSTSLESLKSAISLLSGSNINLLGAVLNKVKLSKRHSYYDYYYRSGQRKKRPEKQD